MFYIYNFKEVHFMNKQRWTENKIKYYPSYEGVNKYEKG